MAASARGLLTSCGVDASSDTGAGHQAGPATARPLCSCHRGSRFCTAGTVEPTFCPVTRCHRSEHHVQGVRRWLQGTQRRGPQAAAGARSPAALPRRPSWGSTQGSHGPLDAQPDALTLKQALGPSPNHSRPGAGGASRRPYWLIHGGLWGRTLPRVRGLYGHPQALPVGRRSTAGAKLPRVLPSIRARGHQKEGPSR